MKCNKNECLIKVKQISIHDSYLILHRHMTPKRSEVTYLVKLICKKMKVQVKSHTLCHSSGLNSQSFFFSKEEIRGQK